MNSTIIEALGVVSTVFTIFVAIYSVYVAYEAVRIAVISILDSYMDRVASNLDGIVTILYVFPNAYGEYDRCYKMASYYVKINNIIK